MDHYRSRAGGWDRSTRPFCIAPTARVYAEHAEAFRSGIVKAVFERDLLTVGTHSPFVQTQALKVDTRRSRGPCAHWSGLLAHSKHVARPPSFEIVPLAGDAL